MSNVFLGKANAANPADALEAFDDAGDMVKVESIVSEFLSAQTLKVLPQGPFGDAVNQFVSKDDKHAMELFVSEHLTGQVQQLLGLESDDEDLNSAMDIYRTRIEQQLASTMPRSHVPERKRVLKPKPTTWDSDFDGNWEDEPDAWTYEDVNPGITPSITQPSQRSRGKSKTQDREDDDLMEEDDGPPAKTAKRSTTRATKAAPAKKAPAKKAPARGRGRKAVEPSEDEEEEDVVMESEEEPAPAPKTRQPARRQAAAPARAARSTSTRQTKLDFSQSQSQAPTQTRRAASKKVVEVSDDEISDEDDAFEPPAVATRATRARRR